MPALSPRRAAVLSFIGADTGLADALTLDARLFSASPDYLFQIQGDSMIEDGILDSDLVGVKRTLEARDGQVVVVRIDGELAIRGCRGEPVPYSFFRTSQRMRGSR